MCERKRDRKTYRKKVLKLDAQAHALLDQERQRINMLKCPGGSLFEQHELCAKAPDNIIRNAAILHAFSNGMGEISGQTMMNALDIFTWFARTNSCFDTRAKTSSRMVRCESVTALVCKFRTYAQPALHSEESPAEARASRHP